MNKNMIVCAIVCFLILICCMLIPKTQVIVAQTGDAEAWRDVESILTGGLSDNPELSQTGVERGIPIGEVITLIGNPYICLRTQSGVDCERVDDGIIPIFK